MSDKDLKGIADVLNSEPVKKFYDEGLSGPIQQASRFITDLMKAFRYMLPRLQTAAARQDALERDLAAYLETIPPSRRLELPERLKGPIIDQIEYLDDTDPLREMFLTLLKKAMDRETANVAHPAFANIIAQLAPDEALMLHLFSKRSRFEEHHLGSLGDNGMTQKNFKLVHNEFPINELTYPENYSVYWSHLESLGLLTGMWLRNEHVANERNEIRIDVIKQVHYRKLSGFGWLFERACDPQFRELESSEA